MAKTTVQELANKLKVSVKDITKKLEEDGIFGVGPEDSLSSQEVVNVITKITGKKVVVKKKNDSAPEKTADKNAEEESRKAAEKAEEEAKAKAKAEEEAKAKAKAEADAAAAKAAEEARAAEKKNAKPAASAQTGRDFRERQSSAQGERPQGNRQGGQNGERSQGNRQGGQNGERSQGSRQGQRPAGQNGDRPYNRNGERPQGQRPAGQNGERIQGSRQGQRPAGQGGYNRDGSKDGDSSRAGQRPAGQGNRPPRTNASSGMADLPKQDAKSARKADWSNKKDNNKKNSNNSASADERTRRRSNTQDFSAQMNDEDMLVHHKKKATKKPQTMEERAAARAAEEEIKMVALPETITVKDFAEALHKPMPQIIKALMSKGIMASMNQTIEFEQAEEIAMELGILVEHEAEEDIFAAYTEAANAPENEDELEDRPPVVVVMGHVDHGKTSLLDAIRDTRVTEREAGGITQHIGASVVEINDRKITFLDTPGHEAFTAMRLRGAMVTDIAVLVVAADDGVMPQTVEAINHAKAAGVQIIVAINKMDKPTANADRIKQELTEYGLIAEDWGGSTICVPVSAKKREGIDNLLEMILLVADMLELKANPDCPAVGTIIESELDKGRGAVATVLIQKGTLHVGDIVVSGSTYGRIKAMVDDTGRRVKEAGPSKPVEIIGLSEVPAAGEQLFVTPNEKEARTLAEKVSARERAKMIEGNKKVSLDNLFGEIQAGEVKDLNIIVKADVQGSVEAVRQSLEKLSTPEVAVHVIHGAVGAISESDVMLASASNSVIIGFNVRPDATAKSTAESEKVDIRLYRVIYNAIEDIQAAMKGMLDPEFVEKQLGHAEVRQIYKVSNVGTIAGSYVTDGKITRSAKARLIRDGIVIYEGEMDSLRRFKDDVKEVASGYECGIMLNKFNDIKEGDVIEAYIMEEVAR